MFEKINKLNNTVKVCKQEIQNANKSICDTYEYLNKLLLIREKLHTGLKRSKKFKIGTEKCIKYVNASSNIYDKLSKRIASLKTDIAISINKKDVFQKIDDLENLEYSYKNLRDFGLPYNPIEFADIQHDLSIMLMQINQETNPIILKLVMDWSLKTKEEFKVVKNDNLQN